MWRPWRVLRQSLCRALSGAAAPNLVRENCWRCWPFWVPQEKQRVTLIGLETLFDLWVAHYDKLTDQARRRLPLRPIQFLSPGG